METKNDSAFWDFVVNLAIIVAAGAMYSKTQEVMTVLSPNTLFGQVGLATIYGFGVAALVEGVTLALHFLSRFEGNVRAEGFKWFLFGVSTFCQFLDKSILKETKTSTEAFFAFIALGIVPAIFFGLLWVKGGSVNTVRAKTNWNGLIPTIKSFFYGNGYQAPKGDVALAKDVPQEKLDGDPAKLTYRKREER